MCWNLLNVSGQRNGINVFMKEDVRGFNDRSASHRDLLSPRIRTEIVG